MQNDSVKFRSLGFLGFPDYEVGDDGSVWSLKYGRRHKLKQPKSCRPHVILNHKGKQKAISVAELVLTAFVGPRPVGYEVCHFPDKDYFNNKLSNLQWGTKQENVRHRQLHGKQEGRLTTYAWGEGHGKAKLDEWQAASIRRSKEMTHVLAKRFLVCRHTIQYIRSGKIWRYL